MRGIEQNTEIPQSVFQVARVWRGHHETPSQSEQAKEFTQCRIDLLRWYVFEELFCDDYIIRPRFQVDRIGKGTDPAVVDLISDGVQSLLNAIQTIDFQPGKQAS